MFTQIEPGYAILASKGVFTQAKLYEFKGRIYAQYNKGFIVLSTRGATSLTGVRHEDVVAPDIKIMRNTLGYLVNADTFDGEKIKI
jgi:hypothetical protein